VGSLRHAVTYSRDERGITLRGARPYGGHRPRSSRRSNDLPGEDGNTVRRAKGARRWIFK